jgi:YD repeat-containing protein
MSLSQDTPGSSVISAHQENGAVVAFTPNGSAYTAPSTVLAALTHDGDGTWTFARQSREIFDFNAAGQLTDMKDLNGYTTRLAYNAGGQLTAVTDPAGRAVTLAYNAASRVSTVTDPAGRVVGYGYDGMGRLTSVTDPAGGATHFAYDSSNLLTTMTSYQRLRNLERTIIRAGQTTPLAGTLPNLAEWDAMICGVLAWHIQHSFSNEVPGDFCGATAETATLAKQEVDAELDVATLVRCDAVRPREGRCDLGAPNVRFARKQANDRASVRWQLAAVDGSRHAVCKLLLNTGQSVGLRDEPAGAYVIGLSGAANKVDQLGRRDCSAATSLWSTDVGRTPTDRVSFVEKLLRRDSPSAVDVAEDVFKRN